MPEISEITKGTKGLQGQIESAMERLDMAGERVRLAELEEAAGASDLWDDQAKATAVTKELAELRRHIEGWESLLVEVRELAELAELEQTDGADDQTASTLANNLATLEQQFATRQTELKLSGPYDKHSALLSIYAGTGGTDAQDWAEMLERMYLRYAETAGFSVQILDRSPGEEAGIKSVTMEVNGPFAFGYLRSEKGVHRLVRLSPYNSGKTRETSFALVDVIPQLDLPEAIEIDPKDLRIDVYRSGGHGGQSVNTTDSAVRITHIPTGTVVAIQNERSQLQNKDKAMAVLKSRLAVLLAEQHKDTISDIRGATQSADFGQQIRSYVLHPYTKVKDNRSGYETSDVYAVLEGKLQPLIEAYLEGKIDPSGLDK